MPSNSIHDWQFQIDAWLDKDTLFAHLAGTNDHNIAVAAWEAAKANYTMRLTFQNRAKCLEVREDTVTGKGGAASG